MAVQFVDDAGVFCFVDDNGVSAFVDDLGNFLSCTPPAGAVSAAGGMIATARATMGVTSLFVVASRGALWRRVVR